MIIVKKQKIVEFTCSPEICSCNKENYKVYGASVDIKKYPNIKLNKYNNVTIFGDIHDLGIGIDYQVKAVETHNSRYGYQYRIENIHRKRPTNKATTRLFLKEILTKNQVDVLMDVYPNIVEKVIKNDLDDIDLSKTHGIKDYTFGVIKRKILENFVFAELIDEFQGLIDYATLKKLYEKHTSIEKIKYEIKNNPYKCLCRLARVGFKTADGILLEFDRESKNMLRKGKQKPPFVFDFDLKTSRQRERAAILYLLEENEKKGNTKMDIKDLILQSRKLAPACSQHFSDIVKKDDVLYYDSKEKVIALRETYLTEFFIASQISIALKDKQQSWDINLEKYRETDGLRCTDQQFDAVNNFLKYNISILNGYAGTGKTQTTNTIIRILRDNEKTFKLIAPTGRASKVLAKYTKQNAYTIHRGLGYIPPNDWLYNMDSKLFHDVIIIDETSMTDIFLMRRLLEAIDFTKTKLLIVGDGFQIPSVGAGNVLFDMVESKIIPTTTLTQVFRFGKGGQMTVATMTREGKQFIPNNQTEVKMFGEDKGYVFMPTKQENLMIKTIKLYSKLLKSGYKPEDILILSCYNVGEYGTVNINKYIQKVANRNYGKGLAIKVGDTEYYKDDIVIQTVNNYKAKIYSHNPFFDDPFGDDSDLINPDNDGYVVINKSEDGDGTTFISNGDIGKIIDVNKNNLIQQYDSHKIDYDRSEAQQLKLAYSISTHKSQGGSCKIAILLTPKAHTFMLNANLMYVGQTRAEDRVFHLGEPETVNRAIKKKENFNRKTFLKELLKENKT